MKPIPAHIGRFSPRELYLFNSLRGLERELRELRSEIEAERGTVERPIILSIPNYYELSDGFTEGQHDV